MKTLVSLRTAIIVLLAVLSLTAGSVLGAQPVTPPAGHEAHHAGTPTPTTPVTTMPGMGASTPAMGGMMQMGEFDLMFIDMMILHHQGAVSMSEVALERGEHPELVQLAEEIIAAQEAEIAQLQEWRDAWYPDAPELAMDERMTGLMPGMQDMGGMMPMIGMMDPAVAAQALRAAGDPFDLAFINAMILHHLSALMMTEMAVQQATHPELVALVQEMYDLQTTEIAQLRAWRAAWYGTFATPAS